MQCFIMDELYIAFVFVAACYSKTLGDVLLAHIISFILSYTLTYVCSFIDTVVMM